MVSPLKADLAGPRIDKGLDDVYVKETSICFIDGQRGRLLYRGYDVRDLAAHSSQLAEVEDAETGVAHLLPERAEDGEVGPRVGVVGVDGLLGKGERLLQEIGTRRAVRMVGCGAALESCGGTSRAG